jgi:hypothetical protein
MYSTSGSGIDKQSYFWKFYWQSIRMFNDFYHWVTGTYRYLLKQIKPGSGSVQNIYGSGVKNLRIRGIRIRNTASFFVFRYWKMWTLSGVNRKHFSLYCGFASLKMYVEFVSSSVIITLLCSNYRLWYVLFRGRARSPQPMKKLRLRGDWSDTGPNSRPETEIRYRTGIQRIRWD